jgi:hypothetical protein
VAAVIDVGIGHCWQHGAAFLSRAFVSVLEFVEHVAMLRIEEDQGRAAIR